MNEYTFLVPNPRNRSGRPYDFVSFRLLLEQYNPTGFVGVAIASEKEGDEVVSRKVNEIRLSAVVLELGEDFKAIHFVSEVILSKT